MQQFEHIIIINSLEFFTSALALLLEFELQQVFSSF